jgi:hypothetical protein
MTTAVRKMSADEVLAKKIACRIGTRHFARIKIVEARVVMWLYVPTNSPVRSFLGYISFAQETS